MRNVNRKFKVLTPHPLHEEAEGILKEFAEVKITGSNEEDILKEITDADAIITWKTRITEKIINASNKLKIIAIRGVSDPTLTLISGSPSLEAATKKGVFVTNVPKINAISVAEHTFALILSLTKGIIRANEFVRSGEWERKEFPEVCVELCGKTLGIVGLGNIGSMVSKRAKAFEMKVLAYDPYISKGRVEKAGAQLVDLETLLKNSDIVSLHVSLTKETIKMIGERELKMMKKSSILINTSRGLVIDEDALYRALKNGWISSAGIDVYEKEPVSTKNKLLKRNNVVLTPHIGGVAARPKVSVVAAKEVERVLRGELPLNLINVEVLKTIKLRNKDKDN